MKLFYGPLLASIVLGAVSYATPLVLNDTFSTSSDVAVTGVTGTTNLAGAQSAPTSAYTRTVFATKSGQTGGGTRSTISSLADGGFFTINAGSGVFGYAGAIYDMAPADLTGSNAGFSIDWVTSDEVPGGAITFFITSNGAPIAPATYEDKVNNILAGGAGVAWKTITTLTSAPQSFSTTISAILAANNNGVNISNITGFGFFWNTPAAQDSTFGNFQVSGVPEPGTYALMGAGLAALAFLRRRK